MELSEAATALRAFAGPNLTRTLAKVEACLQGATLATCTDIVTQGGASNEALAAAGLIKRLAGQVNVVVHALGILLCLPRILAPGEVVEYVSLGAGNTGKPFDLETSKRVAEFKFIRWQGGPEVIRQNALFKDFYLLAEYESTKSKYLYVLGTEHPLRFMNSRRALAGVLSRHVGLNAAFTRKYPKCQTVREYYASRKDDVILQDVSPWLSELVGLVEDTNERRTESNEAALG